MMRTFSPSCFVTTSIVWRSLTTRSRSAPHQLHLYRPLTSSTRRPSRPTSSIVQGTLRAARKVTPLRVGLSVARRPDHALPSHGQRLDRSGQGAAFGPDHTTLSA